MILFILFVPILFTIPIAFAWKLFEKAGQKGFYSIIPYFNIYILLKIIKKDKKWWWYFFIIFPYINIFMLLLMLIELGKCFNKYKIWEEFLAAVLPFVYFPMIAEQGATYTDPDKAIRPKKSAAREWFDAIVFAVVAALIIRTYVFEAFTIPTSSMEKTLLVGDYLIVSKMHYGPKSPNTPLAFPFVHNTLPFSKTKKSYVEWIKLPYHRFPGTSKIKRNDPIVFNYPAGDTVTDKFQSSVSYYDLVREYGRERVWNDHDNFGKVIAHPIDKRENYVKRLIGMPGDKLQIIDGIVHINDEIGFQPENMQYNYLVKTTSNGINENILEKFNITEGYRTAAPNEIMLNISENVVEEFRKLPFVTSATRMVAAAGTETNYELFPHHPETYAWNVDNYGPLVIPKQGATVELTLENLPLYERIIHAYEFHDLEVKDGKIFIDGKESNSYTFGMNYYWMMGDNRHNSADSRYWGFVPEDHIVGKPIFVWLSINKENGKIRFDKMFRIPR
jgi:signal peptidase I, bacterial type/signal peptidase I, bacterial type